MNQDESQIKILGKRHQQHNDFQNKNLSQNMIEQLDEQEYQQMDKSKALKKIKYNDQLSLTFDENVQIVEQWKQNNWTGFNEWIQISKAMVEFQISDNIGTPTNPQFQGQLTIKMPDQIMQQNLTIQTISNNKKSVKKQLIQLISQSLIDNDILKYGIKTKRHQNVVEQIPLTISKQISSTKLCANLKEFDKNQVSQQQIINPKRECNRLSKQMQQLLFQNEFDKACKLLTQIFKLKSLSWQEISYIWVHALQKRNLNQIEQILSLINSNDLFEQTNNEIFDNAKCQLKQQQLSPQQQQLFSEIKILNDKHNLREIQIIIYNEFFDHLLLTGCPSFASNVLDLLNKWLKLNTQEFLNQQACQFYIQKKNILIKDQLNKLQQQLNKPLEKQFQIKGNLCKVGDKQAQSIYIFNTIESEEFKQKEFQIMINDSGVILFPYPYKSICDKEYILIQDESDNCFIGYIQKISIEFNIKLFLLASQDQKILLEDQQKIWIISKLFNNSEIQKVQDAIIKFCTKNQTNQNQFQIIQQYFMIYNHSQQTLVHNIIDNDEVQNNEILVDNNPDEFQNAINKQNRNQLNLQ